MTNSSARRTTIQRLGFSFALKLARLWLVIQFLHDNEQLFATKYKLYLPDEDELRAEIENQKTMFAQQHGLSDEEASQL